MKFLFFISFLITYSYSQPDIFTITYASSINGPWFTSPNPNKHLKNMNKSVCPNNYYPKDPWVTVGFSNFFFWNVWNYHVHCISTNTQSKTYLKQYGSETVSLFPTEPELFIGKIRNPCLYGFEPKNPWHILSSYVNTKTFLTKEYYIHYVFCTKNEVC